MSKAHARQGAGRSGSARAGTSGKGRRTSASTGAASASARGGAKPAGGNAARGGAQRGSANSRAAGLAQRGSTGGARTAAVDSRQKRPPATAARSVAAKTGAVAPVSGKRWLLGMTGIEASTFILSVIGLGIGVYATILHYDTSLKPFCSASGFVNCESVMTSSQSVVFGVFPVAVLGMAFYLFMIAINSPWAWRAKFPAFLGGRMINSRPDVIKWTRLGAVCIGMGFAIYLIYVELVQLSEICLWCTGVHIVTFLLFVIIVFHASFSSGRTETPLHT